MLPNRKVTSKVPEEKHGKTENDGALKINSVNDEKEVGGGGGEVGRREKDTIWMPTRETSNFMNQTVGPTQGVFSAPWIPLRCWGRGTREDGGVGEERWGPEHRSGHETQVSPQPGKKGRGWCLFYPERWDGWGGKWQVQLCNLNAKHGTWYITRPLKLVFVECVSTSQ